MQIVNFDGSNKFRGYFNLSIPGSTPISCEFQLDETHGVIQCVPGVGCKYIVDPPNPRPVLSGNGFNFTLDIKKKQSEVDSPKSIRHKL